MYGFQLNIGTLVFATGLLCLDIVARTTIKSLHFRGGFNLMVDDIWVLNTSRCCFYDDPVVSGKMAKR